jgi:RNA polymerase sigma factor for flagellar operon FliA
MTRPLSAPNAKCPTLRGGVKQKSAARRGSAGNHPAPQADALWQRYRATGDPEARTQLLDRYVRLVYHVARRIGARTPFVETDELASAGSLGLVRALESFDLSRGLAFSTYAVSRIRGAILDELRSRDWTPRSVRAKARRMAEITGMLEQKLDRAPEPREIAAALGIDLPTYWDWRGAVDGNVVVSLDGSNSSPQGHWLRLEEVLTDATAPLPGDALVELQQVAGVREAMGRLPEKERTVLALYYYEELTLLEIAEILHVTESRISQIRSQALRRLRELLTNDAAVA